MRWILGILLFSFLTQNVSGQGVTKHGEDTSTGTDFVNHQGETGNKPALTKFGEILTLCSDCGTITDADGNVYNTIQIGDQCWMAENLKTTKFADGTDIPNITDNAAWESLITPSYCWYENDSIAYSESYGALYNWYAVETNKLCPTGWHVPTDDEWKALEMEMGMTQLEADAQGNRGTNEGSKLAGNELFWPNGALKIDPEFGVSCLDLIPGGSRSSGGEFYYIGYDAFYHTATDVPTSIFTWHRYIMANFTYISRFAFEKYYGKSVRCIKDPAVTIPTLSTNSVTDVTNVSATSGGDITSDGGDAVTAYGICWNTTGNPTLSDSFTEDGTGTGSYSSTLSGLSPNTTYYVRAYATNSIGTAYGNEIIFSTYSALSTEDGFFTIKSGTDELYFIDISDSTISLIAKIGLTIPDAFTGMQYFDGKLYIVTYGELYSYDIESNVLTHLITNANLAWQFSINSAGEYYSVNEISGPAQGSLYKIDISTNTSTFIGQTGTFSIWGLGFDASDQLWATDEFYQVYGTMNTVTGQFTQYSSKVPFTDPAGVTSDHHGNLYSVNPGIPKGIVEYNISSDNSTLLIPLSVTWNLAGIAYKKGLSVATLSTTEPASITMGSATSGGNISGDGGAEITARGVCWSTNANPTIADNITTDGTGTGSYTSLISGLNANTTYYVRAYATNSVGTAYGDEISFTTLDEFACSGVTDIDGNVYSGVEIGNQCWMVENLRTTRFRNGDAIGTTSPATLDISGDTDPIYQWAYDGDEGNVSTYGRLYTWNAVADSRNLCPIGWRTPNRDDFWALYETVAYDGGALKTTGTVEGGAGLWLSPNAGATNSTGFSALPGGLRFDNGTFSNIGMNAGLWSSSEMVGSNGYYLNLNHLSTGISIGSFDKDYAIYVRCIKGEYSALPTIETVAAGSIAQTSALSGGNITDDGGYPVTARGVCWSDISNPSVYDNKTEDGSGTGSYTSSITGLSPNSTYFIRSYATNIIGTTYGEELTFTTYEEVTDCGTVIDIDGNVYNTVEINGDCWMQENLKTTRYRNGDPIGTTTPPDVDITTETDPKYWWTYDGDEGNAAIYGRQYSWYVGQDSRGVCPDGWELPTADDFYQLSMYCIDTYGNDGFSLKEAGTDHWLDNPNDPGNLMVTNVTGFTGLPGGGRLADGTYMAIHETAAFWSADEANATEGRSRNLGAINFYNNFTSTTIDKNVGISIRCKKVELQLPTVSTTPGSGITSTSAQSGGDVISDGGAAVTAYGICWSTTGSPTIGDEYSEDGTGTGPFMSTMDCLGNDVTYYVRAYATNSLGTAYGNEISVTTDASSFEGCGTVTDIDGNTYNTVKIGTQCWMAENLRVTHYNDGTPIVNALDTMTWQTNTSGAYNYFNYTEESYACPYGLYYNWYAVSKNLCPTGWHVATDAEWDTLNTFLGGPSIAGGKLKEAGTVHWLSPNTGATNETGFTALPGGALSSNGTFGQIGERSYYWTASEYIDEQAFYRSIHYTLAGEGHSWGYKLNGNTVRCVQGPKPTYATVFTNGVINITSESAASGGIVSNNGGMPVTKRGICWSTSPDPTYLDSRTEDGTGTGSFLSNLTGLAPNTTYYVRAYVLNTVGLSYGNQVSFTTNP